MRYARLFRYSFVVFMLAGGLLNITASTIG